MCKHFDSICTHDIYFPFSGFYINRFRSLFFLFFSRIHRTDLLKFKSYRWEEEEKKSDNNNKKEAINKMRKWSTVWTIYEMLTNAHIFHFNAFFLSNWKFTMSLRFYFYFFRNLLFMSFFVLHYSKINEMSNLVYLLWITFSFCAGLLFYGK